MSKNSSEIVNNTWLVIPAFNEDRYLLKVLRKVAEYTHNIIVVDDGSDDHTSKVASSSAAYTLSHQVNLGKGAALKTGCDFAFNSLDAQAVILMDADDQHDPAELPLFFGELGRGAAVVLGVREVSAKMPKMRSLTNGMASKLIEAIFGQYIPDIPSGYKAFTKQSYQVLRWHATDYAVEMEIAARIAKHRLQFSVVCIKTIYHDMNKGMTMLDVPQMVVQLLNWRVTL